MAARTARLVKSDQACLKYLISASRSIDVETHNCENLVAFARTILDLSLSHLDGLVKADLDRIQSCKACFGLITRGPRCTKIADPELGCQQGCVVRGRRTDLGPSLLVRAIGGVPLMAATLSAAWGGI
jgi:hypothetical protein